MAYEDTLTLAHFDYELGNLLDEHPLQWDLSDVRFVDAYGLAGLSIVLTEFARRGHRVRLQLPRSDSVLRHMGPMKFGSVIAEADMKLEPPRQPDRDYVLPLERFHDHLGGEVLANLVFDRMESSYRPELVSAMHEAAAELTANAAEHADSQVGAFVGAYTYIEGGRRAPSSSWRWQTRVSGCAPLWPSNTELRRTRSQWNLPSHGT